MDGELATMTQAQAQAQAQRKFHDPDRTAKGEPRAIVPLTRLETLWVNTGTLCNIECKHCYIESSPANDRLVYLTNAELAPFLNEAANMRAGEIGFTGGEPFMNPEMIEMLDAALSRGFKALVLTNAMRPMMRPKVQAGLKHLRAHYRDQLSLRVSIDHYTAQDHDLERGEGAFATAMAGLGWLNENGFCVTVAGRGLSGEDEASLRAGYARLFAERGLPLDAGDPHALIIFPEMDARADIPEISTGCWNMLDKKPGDVMCATSRMLVKRKGASAPVVLACTLLADDPQFEMGASLRDAIRPVKLNHPFCAQFCVLGGASCSG